MKAAIVSGSSSPRYLTPQLNSVHDGGYPITKGRSSRLRPVKRLRKLPVAAIWAVRCGSATKLILQSRSLHLTTAYIRQPQCWTMPFQAPPWRQAMLQYCCFPFVNSTMHETASLISHEYWAHRKRVQTRCEFYCLPAKFGMRLVFFGSLVPMRSCKSTSHVGVWINLQNTSALNLS